MEIKGTKEETMEYLHNLLESIAICVAVKSRTETILQKNLIINVVYPDLMACLDRMYPESEYLAGKDRQLDKPAFNTVQQIVKNQEVVDALKNVSGPSKKTKKKTEPKKPSQVADSFKL